MTQHSRPIWLAALITPVVAPLVVWICLSMLISTWHFLSGAFIAVLPGSYVIMLVVGLPYVLFLRARGMLNALYVCIGATMAGFLAGVLYERIITLLIYYYMGYGYEVVILGMVSGLACGIAFCLISGIALTGRSRGEESAEPS